MAQGVLSPAPPAPSGPMNEAIAPALRIVHVVPSLGHGGLEHVAIRLAEAHRARGHDVTIFALWGGGPLADEAARRGIPVALGRGNRLAGAARAALWMARRRPDIVHAHNANTMHYAALGALAGGARLVVTEHSAPDVTWRTPTRMEQALCAAVVGVSRATALTTVAAASGRDVVVVHNGVAPPGPTRARAAVRAALGLGTGLAAIHVARFDQLKAHDVLLRGLARLRDEGLALTALLVGDGRERERTERLAADLALGPDRVRFLGERADVPDLLGAADLFVLPSWTEGVSLALLEAMIHGLPVVVSAVGGNLEVVRDGEEGLLVPAGDDAALAAALARMAGEPVLRVRLGEAARRRAQEAFSFAVTSSRYEEIYRQVLAGRGRARVG